MYTSIDIKTWERKEHFEFFNALDNPYWGVVATVNTEKAKSRAKSLNQSLYSYYLHAVLKAINKIPAFRLRVQNEDIVLFDKINVSPTTFREDKSFGFSFVEFNEDSSEFDRSLKQEMLHVQSTSGMNLTENASRVDVIHFSALPWIHFSSLSHATSFQKGQSVPRVSVGKIIDHQMPVSLEMHHGFADGYHAGLFFEQLQFELDK